MSRSRREFVKLASGAAAATAATVMLPQRAIAELDRRKSIREALEVEEATHVAQGELAAIALDAARQAGASFADVRVDHQISQSLQILDRNGGEVAYSSMVGVGIRVVANGQSGFAAVTRVTPDAVADAARRAVHQAQVSAKWRTTPVELAPTPVMPDGHWATVCGVDPFAVPVGEQQEALLAGTKAAFAVNGGVKFAKAAADFLRVDRVFASTEGSHIAQTFNLAFPGASVNATVLDDKVMAGAGVDGFGMAHGGYEVVRDFKLVEGMRVAVEEALRRSKARIGEAAPVSVDVGRYEMVVAPEMFWGLIRGTIIAALGMERALGRQEGSEGTTYASPPEAAMGKIQMGAPLLTVRGDRTTPGGLMTVGWDDEGVKPDDITFVQNGVLVDYLALRETVPFLGGWYGSRGMPVRAHGVAATGGWDEPEEATPNITVVPGTAQVTVEDMIKDVKKGIYFPGGGGAGADFGMLNAYGGGGGAQEIRNGKLGRHLKDVAIQFQTPTFWKGLLAIGGPSTVKSYAEGSHGLFVCRTVRSVPARFREVNVVNTGRTQ
jgi:TldD protein